MSWPDSFAIVSLCLFAYGMVRAVIHANHLDAKADREERRKEREAFEARFPAPLWMGTGTRPETQPPAKAGQGPSKKVPLGSGRMIPM